MKPALCAVFFALASTLSGGAEASPAKAKPTVPPEFIPVEDIAGLPRVLLIGDSISMGYTRRV